MMLQLIDKKKIYLYLILLTILISIHNVNFIETFNKIFIVDKINIKSNINKITNDRIYKSLDYFYDLNIFSINPDEISSRISSIALTTEDDSINERLGYYSDAVKSIMEFPVFGIGIGNWKIKSIEYAGVDVNGYTVPYHTHNDFLQISAEIGVIGGIIYLMIYLIPIYQLLIKLKNKVLDNLNLVYLLVISAIFIDSMLNFPLARPVNHIYLLFTLVAMNQTSKANLKNESI